MKFRQRLLWGALLVLPLPATYYWRHLSEPTLYSESVAQQESVKLPMRDHMVRLPGGEFLMGTPRPSPDDQRPVHRVVLAPFWIDHTEVTNREFGKFVAATSHETTAEQRGWSLLFNRETGKWEPMAGVNWRHPTGPETSLAGRENHPVVHVSWHDATSYATWAGKRLPTEAEYEYAARGGLGDTHFPWGRELTPGNRLQANYWQGKFPFTDLGLDGFLGVSPVGQFPPNRFGLYDMVGNVACWCFDWYAADSYGSSIGENPTGPPEGIHRVQRGGSWLATAEPGGGLRVGERGHAPPNETSGNVGFRCARDAKHTVK